MNPTAPSGGARRAAVLGSPIAHSLSPALHRAAYAAMGLGGWRYDRFEVDEAALPAFLGGLDPAEWAGLSLTMPLKRAVIPLLDGITPTAASVEAVNTVVFGPDGRRGDNTDIPGLLAALYERGITTVPSAAVLGAGATASSALAALSRICTGEVTAYVRSAARAAEMRQWGERLGVAVRTAGWDGAAAAFDAPLVIATTPAGAADHLADAVPQEPGALFDVLYHPWPTPLAAAWSARGGTVLGGLDLLVHQAVLQIEQYTGHTGIPVDAMRAAGEAALGGG
ncbi:shikimate dehydrogenase [Streptomyces sp. NRRL F-5123]|uniref:shikimate dehydrogenase n=1 Tax=Streptomyces sp. NRRL F-5123 TaxID=1463856 RepID=UPI0004E2287C|nr:shikimate dehydrogenase [Streptomyces sp. NRRL F-5123]